MRSTRLARWGAALALALTPGLATAQDGQPPSGPPVTAPNTNARNPRIQTATPPARTSAEVLQPVPATPSDPAPPGTRAVPAGSPAAAPGAVPGGPQAPA